jgi:Tol biopolymer transport system component
MARRIGAVVIGAVLALPSVAGAATYRGRNGKIAFNSRGHVYVMNADGTRVGRIGGSIGSRNPTISPNGKRLAFEGGTRVFSAFRIYVMGITGHPVPRPISRLNHRFIADHAPTWSPNGRKIAAACFDEKFVSSELCVMNSDGSHRREFTHCRSCLGAVAAPSNRLQWAPTGDRLVYSTGHEIWTIRANGSGRRMILDPAQSGGAEGSYDEPVWTPDGPDGGDIEIANADGSNRRIMFATFATDLGLPAFDPAVFPGYPVVSPDSTQLAFAGNTSGGPVSIIACPFSGAGCAGQARIVRTLPNGEYNPQTNWGPR